MRYVLIPARAGSKTILDKNLVDLGGHPLIQWTIKAAKAAAGEAPVYVTSEDGKILDVAEACGALAHKRPEHLADDHANMLDVVRDFFKAAKDAEEVVLLFPTCPFRSATTIKQALAVFDQGTLNGAHQSLMSLSENRGRPYGGVNLVNGRLFYEKKSEMFYRKQDTPALYHANGAIFVIRRQAVDALNTQLFNKDTVPFVMYGMENLDIDTPFDLEVARAWVAAGRAKPDPKWVAFSAETRQPVHVPEHW